MINPTIFDSLLFVYMMTQKGEPYTKAFSTLSEIILMCIYTLKNGPVFLAHPVCIAEECFMLLGRPTPSKNRCNEYSLMTDGVGAFQCIGCDRFTIFVVDIRRLSLIVCLSFVYFTTFVANKCISITRKFTWILPSHMGVSGQLCIFV